MATPSPFRTSPGCTWLHRCCRRRGFLSSSRSRRAECDLADASCQPWTAIPASAKTNTSISKVCAANASAFAVVDNRVDRHEDGNEREHGDGCRGRTIGSLCAKRRGGDPGAGPGPLKIRRRRCVRPHREFPRRATVPSHTLATSSPTDRSRRARRRRR